jgi:hypothetical protein
MSISIPEAGINVEERFFNPTTTTAVLTASFEAAKDVSDYNITASIINNKGNESNSDISWYVTGSTANDASQVTASFQIVKDTNIQKVGIDDIITNSTGSSFKNEYAFNITASLSGSFTSSYTNSVSSSISTTNWLFKSDALGINISTISSSVNLTASFTAQTDVEEYDFTASAISRIESASFFNITTVGSSASASFIGEVVQNDTIVIKGLPIESLLIGGPTSSMRFYSSSVDTPGNFTQITTFASSSLTGSRSQLRRTIKTADNNYFPWPFVPTYDIDPAPLVGANTVAYFGKPSITTLSGVTSTTYFSGSNITLHYLGTGSVVEFSSSFTPTTGSHILTETLTVAGGGRGGIKDYVAPQPFQVPQYIFTGAGGAGGYVLAENYYKKGITYDVVVGDGAPRWDGTPYVEGTTIITGSDSYIYGDNVTVQLSKGGGFGGPLTGSAWLTVNLSELRGANGGSAGSPGFVQGQLAIILSDGIDGTLTGSVTNPFENYGAFDGFSGGTSFGNNIQSPPFFLAAPCGGGASISGSSNATFDSTKVGGLGKFDLSFTPQKVAGGGIGGNFTGQGVTQSIDFGGGLGQQYNVSGSVDACDGIDGTGGGGGGLVSGSGLLHTQTPLNYTTKGGSGKVQIRYISDVPLASGGTIESGSISGSNYILHTFLSSSTFTVFE